jgi:PAS domain S-box-containing protein
MRQMSVSNCVFVIIACSFIAGIASMPSVQGASDGRPTLTFGVVPQLSATKLAGKWTPILQRLGDKTGYTIRFRTAPDIPAFEQRLATGEYDMAYMNPYHYTVFHESPGYVAFAKEKDKRIKGIMVVRKDSSYCELNELANQTLAFPAPAAFAASVLTRAIVESAAAGIITIDERGTILSFDGSAEQMFGYTDGEALGQNIAVLMPSPDNEEHDSHARRYLDTGVTRMIGAHREEIGRRKNGWTSA